MRSRSRRRQAEAGGGRGRSRRSRRTEAGEEDEARGEGDGEGGGREGGAGPRALHWTAFRGDPGHACVAPVYEWHMDYTCPSPGRAGSASSGSCRRAAPWWC